MTSFSKSPLASLKAELAVKDHPVWEEVASHFSPAEFQNPHEMDAHFIRWLYKVRLMAGVPIRVTSDARHPEKDIGAKKSAHKKRPCRAIDCKVKNSYERACVVLAAARCGGVRIGIYPGGSGDGGVVHLDCETASDNQSPRIWTKY